MAYENQPSNEYETIKEDTLHCLKEQPPHAPDYLLDNDCENKGRTGRVRLVFWGDPGISLFVNKDYIERPAIETYIGNFTCFFLFFFNSFIYSDIK